jgi:transcriptional regulator with XRE-family HTH domain
MFTSVSQPQPGICLLANLFADLHNGVVTSDEVDVLSAVGPRLRELRKAHRFTLVALAAESGLATSTLSRLETGKLRPTLEQLLPLARAFNLPLDDLVAAPLTGDPRIHLRPMRHSGLTFIPLARRPGGIQAYKIVYPPLGKESTLKRQTHEGYEWLYVLNGKVRLLLGAEEFLLGPGEAAQFDTRTLHWIGSATEQPAEVITLMGTQGERTHLAVTSK